jgi:nucleotide-binding universal stress UspA family protein
VGREWCLVASPQIADKEERVNALVQEVAWDGHVACFIDGSDRSWAALAGAWEGRLAGARRQSVVYADRWAGLAATAQVWVPDLTDIRSLLEGWLREELDRRGLDDAAAVVLADRSPRTLCLWARTAAPDVLLLVDPGGSRLGRLLHGGGDGYLVRHAPCPVETIGAAPARRRRGVRASAALALRGPRP